MNTTTSHKTSKHRELILAHLQAGDTLTATQARIKYDCHNLAARISELRLKDGHKIESIKIGGGFVKYELDTNQPYEREFFEFLKGKGKLDEFISKNIKYHDTFKLDNNPISFIAGAFIWGKGLWGAMSIEWIYELGEIQRKERLTSNA